MLSSEDAALNLRTICSTWDCTPAMWYVPFDGRFMIDWIAVSNYDFQVAGAGAGVGVVGAFEEGYGYWRCAWRRSCPRAQSVEEDEDGEDGDLAQMDRVLELVESVGVDDLHAQETRDYDGDENIGHRLHCLLLHPEPAQHFSAQLGRGYEGEGDFDLPTATTNATTETAETTRRSASVQRPSTTAATTATTKAFLVVDGHADHTDDDSPTISVCTNRAER